MYSWQAFYVKLYYINYYVLEIRLIDMSKLQIVIVPEQSNL